MKTKLPLVLLSAAVLSITAFGYAREDIHDYDSRAVVFTQRTCTLGTIPLRTRQDTAFVFRAAADVVVVLSATTNCSCTTAEFPRKPLKREERGVIRVRFEAREPGFFRKTITVKYVADGIRHSEILTLEGMVAESKAKDPEGDKIGRTTQ